MTDSQKNFLYRSIFITVLILAVYGNTLNHGFVWDDTDIIVDNPLLGKLSNIPKYFLSEDRIDSPTGYYRPMTYASFALDRAIWGLNPVGFNITDLLLHIVVTLTFYRVVAALFKREQLAFAAALLFSLHPIAGETVNFHAGGRNTLLCACFALLSLLCYINKKNLLAILCFTVAIFSKEFALLLPVIFFLYDKYIDKNNKSWLYYGYYLPSIVLYLTLRSFAVQKANFFTTMHLSDSLFMAPCLVVKYFINMVFPFGIKVLYDIDATVGIYHKLLYLFLLVAIISAAFFYRKHREILFSLCWFLLFLLPVTNIIPLGDTIMADRYAYFSLMGFSVALAFIIGNANKRLIAPLLIGVCFCFALVDFQRNHHWKDNLSLFTQMTKDAPAVSLGFQNLGIQYLVKGDLVNAETYLTQAYDKKNATFKVVLELLAIYLQTGKLDNAVAVLNKEIARGPGNLHAYVMLSSIYDIMGKKAMAKEYLDKATTLFPGIEEMLSQRAMSLCRKGEKLLADRRYYEAEAFLVEALLVKPNYVPTLLDMGSLYAEKGNLTRSVEYFSKALALDPLNPAAHYNLSMTYELMGKSAEAQEEMKKYRELDERSRQKGN